MLLILLYDLLHLYHQLYVISAFPEHMSQISYSVLIHKQNVVIVTQFVYIY